MINIFDTAFREIRNKVNKVVLPFHPVFLTDLEASGEFETFYGELDETYGDFSHFGLFKSKQSEKLYAILLTQTQFNEKTKT